MRIEEDLKLGFKDVLIRPKRSTLKSRSEVELERHLHIPNTPRLSWQARQLLPPIWIRRDIRMATVLILRHADGSS